MRAIIIAGAVAATLAGAAEAAGGSAGHGALRGEGVAGASATARSHTFPTLSAGGRSDFRSGGFARFGGRPGGGWGFQHAARSGGEHYGRRDRLRRYGFWPGLEYGSNEAPYGYGYDAGAFGPEAPYGDSAAEIGFPPPTPPFAPALAQGPYGPGYGRSAYIGQVYTSGRGAYSYGYNGYAETPPLPHPVPPCGC
jgi:hypothetical protein